MNMQKNKDIFANFFKNCKKIAYKRITECKRSHYYTLKAVRSKDDAVLTKTGIVKTEIHIEYDKSKDRVFEGDDLQPQKPMEDLLVPEVL